MHNQTDYVDRCDAHGGGERHPAAAAHSDYREDRAEPEGSPHPRCSRQRTERCHRGSDQEHQRRQLAQFACSQAVGQTTYAGLGVVGKVG